jgi:hypothetical protein
MSSFNAYTISANYNAVCAKLDKDIAQYESWVVSRELPAHFRHLVIKNMLKEALNSNDLLWQSYANVKGKDFYVKFYVQHMGDDLPLKWNVPMFLDMIKVAPMDVRAGYIMLELQLF